MDKTNSITEVVRQSQRVFKGVRFDVYAVELPGKVGHSVRREFVAHPGAVVILPILDEQHIVMIRNERFAVGQELWELPAGTLEPKEPPEKTAYRELIEETGYQADSIQPLTKFFTSPGICNEMMYVYVARDLHLVGQQLDESEKIIVKILDWKTVNKMIHSGEICDGKTLTTLLFYQSQLTKVDEMDT